MGGLAALAIAAALAYFLYRRRNREKDTRLLPTVSCTLAAAAWLPRWLVRTAAQLAHKCYHCMQVAGTHELLSAAGQLICMHSALSAPSS